MGWMDSLLHNFLPIKDINSVQYKTEHQPSSQGCFKGDICASGKPSLPRKIKKSRKTDIHGLGDTNKPYNVLKAKRGQRWRMGSLGAAHS